MSAYSTSFWYGRDLAAVGEGLRLKNTAWGARLTGLTTVRTANLLEASLKVLAIFAVLLAIALWAAPVGGVLVARLAITVGFLAVGMAIYQYGGRGFRQEVEFDGVRGTIRLVTRNARGTSYVRRRIPMVEAESCYLGRSKTPGAPSQLYLRLKGRVSPLAIGEGDEAELVPVLERLAEIVKSARRRNTIAERAA